MNISIHGAHDASISFIDKSGEIRIFEVERFCKIRSVALSSKFDKLFDVIDKKNYIDLLKLIKSESKYAEFDTCFYNQLFEEDFSIIHDILRVKNFIKTNHHRGHARCAYHQSNFEECLIFSFDGGGHDEYDQLSFFNVYKMYNNFLEKIDQFNINFGTAYALLGIPINEIKKNKNINVYAGKLMGLSGYGNVNETWINHFKEYYSDLDLNKLFSKINIKFEENCVNGQISYDLAKTSQFVFESLFLEKFLPLFEKYNLPICLTGGCALNVLNNEKIKNIVGEKNIYIPPNPNDAGLSYGYFLDNTDMKYEKKQSILYSGFNSINKDILTKEKKQLLNINTIINYISANKIIGIVRGYSECGPRALGNRSLICYPTNSDLKNKINSNIKFREWFRPFAAVVRKQDVNIYFENIYESKYMSFCPKIKDKYKEKFPSIIHVDDTCRVQTVTVEENEFIYNLLTSMYELGLEPILLNTSFNIKGKPLVNDINDVLSIYNNIAIDGIIIDDYMMLK